MQQGYERVRGGWTLGGDQRSSHLWITDVGKRVLSDEEINLRKGSCGRATDEDSKEFQVEIALEAKVD